MRQPDWRSAEDFARLGKPNLFFGITAGNMDSMVNRYTSDRRIRSDDAYTPAGEGGKRPDRSVIVYSQRVREAFNDVPIVTRDDVRFAKPDPDLFLAAGQRLKVPMSRCIIVGDSVWDLLAARRAFGLGVGLLSGGYGRVELERAGAYRVYQDPAELLGHLDEVGVRLG